MHQLTAAHRTLPFGTVVRVERRDGDRAAVEVRVNDRGPFIAGRIIDLSYAAARRIGLDRDGVAPVEVQVLGAAEQPSSSSPLPERPAKQPADAECYWVQVGAFADADNARRARTRLEAAGETAVVLEGPGGLMRVRIGPLDRRRDADAARSRIAAEWPEAAVRPCGG